jgi:hypothetical protein
MREEPQRFDPAALAKEAADGTEDPSAPGKFAKTTLLALGGGAVGFLVCLAGIWATGGETKLNAIFIPGLFVFGVMTIAGVLKFIGDAVSTSPGNRTTPQKAIKVYLNSVERQRWDAAFACLSWVAKDGREAARPAIPEVELAADSFPISTRKDLQKYWDAFVGSFKSRGQRSFWFKTGTPYELSESVATIPVNGSVTLDMRTASLGGKAMRRHGLHGFADVKYKCNWPVYESGGLWYILKAGFPPDFTVRIE